MKKAQIHSNQAFVADYQSAEISQPGESPLDFPPMLVSLFDFLACRSEAEARFLKVFLEAGLTEIMVPEDDEYLAGILPELESLKKRIDEIIDHFIDAILDRRIREEVRHRVYGEITR